MEYDLAIDEFTAAGELAPADPIRWTGSEELGFDEGLERAGWRLAWSMEEPDEPPEKPVSAYVYEQLEATDVLIHLVALGVGTWVLCRSRMAYLRFLRDWLGELTDLKQSSTESDLEEAVEELQEDAEDLLEEAAGSFTVRVLPPAGRRGRQCV